jgi:hypothetical protein
METCLNVLREVIPCVEPWWHLGLPHKVSVTYARSLEKASPLLSPMCLLPERPPLGLGAVDHATQRKIPAVRNVYVRQHLKVVTRILPILSNYLAPVMLRCIDVKTDPKGLHCGLHLGVRAPGGRIFGNLAPVILH